ncbi:hypothetical protein OG785_14220 [Streptomyces sp. NBC_00006]|uniref:hypothetical protein n=1 Tax=unclassified Streptomyces TaxID=2593676 RepID=UPI00225151FA|nr:MULTISPECIES: hypothetical protein [unclassified Streptomyces]MCX4828931.1 hypothetical protein [Streptomyces sp. NBC_01016]MCX5531718.1 hypothetical protein [Streptomyces sp. NBC_00006]
MTANSSPPVEPGGEPDGAGRAADRSSVGALLGDAVRGGDPGVDGERRALAAYREARDAGALGAAPRRRDDWRPGLRWAGWPVRAAANSPRGRGR